MAHKANQNKTAQKVEKTAVKKQPADHVESPPEVVIADIVDVEFPESLNEELDALLKKNPRRFFGGCGG